MGREPSSRDRLSRAIEIKLMLRRFSTVMFCAISLLSSATVIADEAELSARIERLERTIESRPLLEMLRRLDSLQQDVQNMRGEIDQLNFSVEGIKKRQRDLYLDIDQRLSELGSSDNNGASNNATVPPSNADTAATRDNRKELTEYQNAFEILRAKRYDDAIIAFKSYIERYPSGKFVANAKYWLGEANYVTRRFPVAIEQLNRVLKDHPKSNKVQDALLKIGFSYYELKQWPEARASLQKLADVYPNSTAGKLAQKRLDQMDADGR